MKKRKFLILVFLFVFILEVATVLFWLMHCKNLHGILHINFGSIWLALSGEIHQDQLVPYTITRIFHNKPIDLFVSILKLYLRFWDLVLNQGLFSFAGSFGILAAGWYFLENKSKKILQWLFVLAVLMLPFVEIFFSASIPFLVRIGLYLVILSPVSLLGIRKFLGSFNKSIYVLLVLLVLSVLWLFLGGFDFSTYCLQYP